MRLLSTLRRKGSTLIVTVLVMSLVTVAILASTLDWTTTDSTLSHRQNEYYRTVAIAEAATEAVITRIDSDYKKGGDALLATSLESYKQITPTKQENELFAGYEFSDSRQQNRTHVEYLPPSGFRVLTGAYRGLYGYSSIYRVISNARDTKSRFNITGAVRQDIELSTIPLFQFAIFYNLDMEIHPGATMNINGPVHGNKNIYVATSSATVNFHSDVTASQNIIHGGKPGDPQIPYPSPGGSITFSNEHDSGASLLDLPIGTNNTPAGVRQVVEPPPVGESLTSPLGKERFHNKADMIITVSSAGAVSARSGPNTLSPGTVVPPAQVSSFVTLPSFYNKREGKTVNAVQIDVAAMNSWNATNIVMRNALSTKDVTIIFVVDQRAISSSTEPGVRMVNGQTLPPQGLTVASPYPIYVKGDYNVPDAAKGTHDTSGTKPAALIGDAFTVLSANWSDLASVASGALSLRVAKDTTINAAVLAGIVETVGGNYSGGVENFPRFLEDWSGKKMTYTGSMVVMYPSTYAKAPWQTTGSVIGIYNPPVRDWAFDTNFRDPVKLPPGAPAVRVLIRSVWAMIKPKTTVVASP